MLFVSISIANVEFEPLDLLEPNVQAIFDINDNNDVNDVNITPLNNIDSPKVDNAQANLVAKMEDSANLQAELQKLINQINSVQFKSKEESQSF
jgi:hypothetical protein